MIIFNKYFETNILNKVSPSCSIPINLLTLINHGFVLHSNGCVFFKLKQPVDMGIDKGDFFDKTDQECLYNELRISDYTKDNIISVAVNASEMIANKLHEAMPSEHFEVITSFDDFNNEIDAVIKFHTLRKEEVPYIDLESIEEYQQPIFICRTDK
ncbi:hypothetical protein PT300_08265 [Enterobacteriaceae bacterium ESL0689]|nr:hypothetical protein [Enterobacteriaceae bacterium ESL0689]